MRMPMRTVSGRRRGALPATRPSARANAVLDGTRARTCYAPDLTVHTGVPGCIGIGGTPHDVDESLMRDIASEYPDGSKRYRWIGDKERLAQHFHCLAGRITRSC